MDETVDRRFDIGVALFLIVIAAVAIWQAADLPPGSFEPLGSAWVPQITAGIIILLSLLVILRALLRADTISAADTIGAADAIRGDDQGRSNELQERWHQAAAVALLTVLYVAAMHLRLTTFAIVTTVFLTATILVLVRFELKRLPLILVVAAVTGFGCQYIFTRIFVIDLPGL